MVNKSPRLPLTHALGWIVGSMLFVNGIAFSCLKMALRHRHNIAREDKLIRSIVQTGPQKEALKTEYLAESLGICADHPQNVSSFDLQKGRERLLSSPLIAKASVSVIKPNILYIDYTVRQPIAFLADFENVAIDKEGYPFPFAPFFSPKNLPEIYLGISSFGTPSEDSEKPVAQWGCSLKGKYLDLALEILSYVTDSKVFDDFNVTWIDVSQAFSNSCGTREIILTTQDAIFQKEGREEIKSVFPRTLRLSTKHYAQELGNYLKLRFQLLEEDRKRLTLPGKNLSQKMPERIIDFRIPNLAFVEEKEMH
jgi:hypothetical protein